MSTYHKEITDEQTDPQKVRKTEKISTRTIVKSDAHFDIPQELVIRLADLNNEYSVDFVSFLGTIWRWKWFVLIITIITTSLALFISTHFMPFLYTSNAVIEPFFSKDKTVSIAANLGYFLPSLQSNDNKYQTLINYIKSRSLKIHIIEKFDLLPRLYPKQWDNKKKEWIVNEAKMVPTVTKALQRNALRRVFSVVQDEKTALITIYFTDKDPIFASNVVSGIVEEVDRYLKEDHITDAKRHRIFIEEQLTKSEQDLFFWERQRPGEKFDASVIMREKQTAMAIYSELRKEYEQAKIEEDKQLVAFKILDKPVVPELMSSPNIVNFCILVFFSTVFLCLIISFIVDYLKNN